MVNGSTIRSRGRRLIGLAAGLGLVIALATPALGEEGAPAGEQQGEGCPAGTSLLVTFSWGGASFAPDGGNALGVELSGDSDLAFFRATQEIAAVVVAAGAETRHITLDSPETTGSISPHHYEIFGGASIESLGFCVGAKVNPDSGSSVSVLVTKTAGCATPNTDGTATVTGSIEVNNHSRDSARLTSALDTVFASGDVALNRTTITSLVGVVLVPDEVATVTYSVTFDPMGHPAFTNFIEVTIERADTGVARHKVYQDRAAFELCDQTLVPTPTPTASPTQSQSAGSPRGTVQAGNPTPGGSLPNTAMDDVTPVPAMLLSLVLVGSLAAMAYVRIVRPR